MKRYDYYDMRFYLENSGRREKTILAKDFDRYKSLIRSGYERMKEENKALEYGMQLERYAKESALEAGRELQKELNEEIAHLKSKLEKCENRVIEERNKR